MPRNSCQSSPKSNVRFCTSVDSKYCQSSEMHNFLSQKQFPEGTTGDAIGLLQAKRKYLDRLPINEEDKQAILRYHLDKKRIKDLRIRKVQSWLLTYIGDL